MENQNEVLDVEVDIVEVSSQDAESEEDITVMIDEPRMTKKVKLDEEKNFKEVQSTKKSGSAYTSAKKEQEKDTKKASGSKKTGDKLDSAKSKKKNEPEEESDQEDKKPRAKQPSKTKEVPKIDRKVEKAKDKEQKKQLKLAFTMEPKEEKKLVPKQKTEQEKQLAELEKKYPEFIVRGKFKFPIDDKLFNMYSSLLAEHMPTAERPKPKSDLIPPQMLGDILHIWNFFNTFSELFKFEDIKKEEIYASLAYDGDEHLLLVNDMHQGVLSLYLQEFIKKNRFETQKDDIENSFFVLLKNQVADADLNGDELALIWTEFASKLIHLSPFCDFAGETTKKFFDTLGEKTCLGYNKLEYRMKIRILSNLIEALHDTDTFREFIQARMDATGVMAKEMAELEQEIKQEEQMYQSFKIKVALSENEIKKEEQGKGLLFKPEKEKRTATDATKKEYQKNVSELNKIESVLNKLRKRVEDIDNEICLALQTASRIGVDVHKAEYWIFQADPERLYVRYPQMVTDQEEWHYYDKKSELDQLMQSLNVKGIKEKQLLESLQELVKKGRLSLKDDANNKENVPASGEMETEIMKNKFKQGQEPADFNFWIAKVLEYEDSPAAQAGTPTRVTRKKRQTDQAVQKPKIKTPKDLNFNQMKQMLIGMEDNMTAYLAKWGSMWERPSIKEHWMNKIFEANSVKDFKTILLKLNDMFQFSKAPLGPKDGDNKKSRNYLDRDDEEGEEATLSDEDKPYSGSKRSDGTKSPYTDENSNSRSKDDEDETKAGSPEPGKKRGGKSSGTKSDEMDEEPLKKKGVSPGQGFDLEPERTVKKPKASAQTFDEEAEKLQFQRVKRYPLRFWGMYGTGGKMRRTWVAYTTSADNIAAVYYSTLIFCEFINKYCDRMNARYFSIYKTGAEFMAARRQSKQAGSYAHQQFIVEDNEDSQQSLQASNQEEPEEISIDALDKFRHNRKTVVRGAKPVRDKQSEGKNTVESDNMVSRLRDRKKGYSYADPVTTTQTRPKKDEKARKKQEKLDELANLRRSSRLSRKKERLYGEEDDEEEEDVEDDIENVDDEEDEEEEEAEECRTCGEQDGEMVTCIQCNDSYHLYCAGLKRRQVDKNDWTCADCSVKKTNRSTRSSSRRVIA